MENKMKDYNQEYFYVSDTRGDMYPTLAYAAGGGNFVEVDKAKPLDTSEKRIMCFQSRTSSKPQLADFHCLKHYAPVISEGLKNVLDSFNLKDVQFLPAAVRDNEHNLHEGYYILHVYNQIQSMDWEKSRWDENEFNEKRPYIDNLVLDNALIDQVPLEERLVFTVWEDSSHLLFHYSVVEEMLKTAPKGLTIYRLSTWDSSLPFIEDYIDYLEK